MAGKYTSGAFLPHVNGIRALAIIGVLIYHLNSRYCPTGYFGVDVFLVISGYFLFRSLMNSEKAVTFHYGRYLLGKAWRILPSWFVCCLVACVVSVLLMRSMDSLLVVNTAFASSFAAVDYYIDRCYDYFNARAHLNPLLHFWYLSLTIQLYVIAPILVVPLLRSRFRKAALRVLCMLGAASFVFYILTTTGWLSLSEKNTLLAAIGARSVYYHLIPRFWEIVAGYLILYLPALDSLRRVRSVVAFSALLGIMLSFFLYRIGSPNSYLSVVSTMLLVRYGDSGVCRLLLAWKPVQIVGDISFSLYLWHWPIMVLWKYFCFTEVSLWDETAMLLLSFSLGYIAWRVVERRSVPGNDRGIYVRILVLVSLPLVFIMALGAHCYLRSIANDIKEVIVLKNAQPTHQDAELVEHLNRQAFSYQPVYCGRDECIPAEFMLMGDSHSLHLYPGLSEACAKHQIRGIFFNNSIVPFWGVYQDEWNTERESALLEYLKHRPNIEYVLVSMYWSRRLAQVSRGHTLPRSEREIQIRTEGVKRLCAELVSAGVKVILTLDTPVFPDNVSPLDVWARRERLGLPPAAITCVTEEKNRLIQASYSHIFSQLKKEGYVHAVIDLSRPLMKNDVCVSRVGNDWWFWDSNHLTASASKIVGEYLAQELKKLIMDDAVYEPEKE